MGQRWPKVAQVVWQADPQRYSSFGLLQTSFPADVAVQNTTKAMNNTQTNRNMLAKYVPLVC